MPRRPSSTPVRHITFDAQTPYAVAEFWAAVTGYALIDPDPGCDQVLMDPPVPETPGLLFVRVPEDKTVKNRVHLDIQPPTGTRDAEVARLQTLGARVVSDHRTPDGMGGC
jgi:hypothetical protein